MIEVYPDLFVGTEHDYNFQRSFQNFANEFSFIGAAKYPWHKAHARMDGSDEEGYLGKALPKDQKEYLYAEREHALYCNLIDAPDAKYIPDEIIQKCLEFIESELEEQHRKVLICCNKGESRSPSIALMYMISKGKYDDCEDYSFMQKFKEIYPFYNPAPGIGVKVIEFYEKRKGNMKNV